ncbi:MAG TPA: glycosyltransferase [Verrucomicrobiae bacterium]|nr:glycosyltransferase [Verrucomicrobiae bacterium]
MKRKSAERPSGPANWLDHIRRGHRMIPVKISIVVPAFNEERLLGETLSRIKSAAEAFLQRGWPVELIVCDNNSTDRTADIARAAGATVVFEPVNQIARARNRGAAAATGDWLIFVDADSHPRAELFSDVADQIASGKCIAGGVTVRMDGNHFWAHRITTLWNWISRFFKMLAGSFIFCEANAFREIGGFSDKLFATEELELSQRLKKFAKENGKRIVILRKHPLITSSRKMKLYSAREHLKLLWRISFNREILTQRDACHIWYDGRR